MMEWYTLRVISGKEKKIKDAIINEVANASFQDRIQDVLVPTENIIEMRDGKKKVKERVFFPGYILIEAALVGEVPHVIKNVTGVIGFLGDKQNNPVPLRPSEVNRILGKVDELAESEEEMNIPYVVGETVKVIDGPFNSFSGIIEDIDEVKKKLKVMVKIFGRKTPLELNFMQVEKE